MGAYFAFFIHYAHFSKYPVADYFRYFCFQNYLMSHQWFYKVNGHV